MQQAKARLNIVLFEALSLKNEYLAVRLVPKKGLNMVLLESTAIMEFIQFHAITMQFKVTFVVEADIL